MLLPNLFDRLQEMQDQSKVNWIKDYDKGNACLRLLNDSVIWFRPYNRISKLRGLTLTWAAADEVEWSEADPEEIWTVITGRLRGHGPCPGFLVATSPNGMRGITRKFVEAQRSYLEAKGRGTTTAPWDAYRITSATSFDNPYLPQHFFDSLSAMSRRRYQQEVEGKVLRPLHTVLSLESRHLVEWSWREHMTLPRVYGVDWGGQDHHVAVMAQVRPDGQWVVADEARMRRHAPRPFPRPPAKVDAVARRFAAAVHWRRPCGTCRKPRLASAVAFDAGALDGVARRTAGYARSGMHAGHDGSARRRACAGIFAFVVADGAGADSRHRACAARVHVLPGQRRPADKQAAERQRARSRC